MEQIAHPQFKNPIEDFDSTDSELIIGFVCAVGTDYRPVCDALKGILAKYGYRTNIIRVSDLISALIKRDFPDSPETLRISSRMDAGNAGCLDSGRRDLWALATIAKINASRPSNEDVQQALPSTAHLVFSLKRPEEVQTLRKVYGPGFFLVGVFATE